MDNTVKYETRTAVLSGGRDGGRAATEAIAALIEAGALATGARGATQTVVDDETFGVWLADRLVEVQVIATNQVR